MKFLAIFLGAIALAQSSVIHHNRQVYLPASKTTVLGPSGSISHEEYLGSSKSILKDDCVHEQLPVPVKYTLPSVQNIAVTKYTPEVHYIVENSPIAVNTVVEQHVVPSVVTTKAVSAPFEKTTVLGSSGVITEEKYSQSKIAVPAVQYGVPAVQYAVPSVGKLAVAHESHVLSTPLEKTTVIRPSNAIIQEVSKIPVVAQYAPPAVEKVVQVSEAHVATAEKTSVVGPSGLITQEKYLQSPPLEQHLVYKLPTAVQQTTFVKESLPIEKTKVVGPSGLISSETYSGSVNLSPVKVKVASPIVASYGLPASNLAVVKYNSDSAPIEKTSITGPSGSIVQTKGLHQAVKSDVALKIQPTHSLGYPVVKLPVAVNEPHVTHIVSSPLQAADCVESISTVEQKVLQPNIFSYGIVHQEPVQLHYTAPLIKNVGVISWEQAPVKTTYTSVPINTAAYSYVASPVSKIQEISSGHNVNVVLGNNGVERTSIVGPSGSITHETNSKSILTPVAEVKDIPVSKVVAPYALVKDTVPSIVKTDAVKTVQTFGPYPPAIAKYPTIAALDC